VHSLCPVEALRAPLLYVTNALQPSNGSACSTPVRTIARTGEL
jgi:hypothetical protein